MNSIEHTLSGLNKEREGYLGQFFSVGQWVRLSHWAKNAWFHILKISLFGEISENVAVDIVGHEMIGPCTIVICAEHCRSRLYIADKVGVSHIDLFSLSVFQLERLAGLLRGRIFPADIDPSDRTKARQECLQGEISFYYKEHPLLYLAGL